MKFEWVSANIDGQERKGRLVQEFVDSVLLRDGDQLFTANIKDVTSYKEIDEQYPPRHIQDLECPIDGHWTDDIIYTGLRF